MRGGTLFSGICAPETACPEIDWRWRAEIDPFANAVAEYRHPGIPNLGNVEEIDPDATEPVDLVVFGSPCQSFSVAGKRLGLDDPRGNLTLIGLGVVGRVRPRWVVWENVPGVLSIDGGRTFGAVLGLLGQLGYGFAYRVLDAQYFGVPQRRRRVFVVGYLGDWRPPAAVLFERESLSGNPPPRREAGEGVARCLATGANSQRYDGESEAFVTHSLRADGFDTSEDGTGRGTPLVPVAFSCKDHGADASELAPTLRAMPHDGSHANAGGQVAVAFQEAQTGCREYDTAGTLRADGPGHDPVGTRVREGMAVRRLTPRECERLQGFPDDYTLVPYRGKPAADGPRYRALGNSMAVPVMHWILSRVLACDALLQVEAA